MSSSEDQVETVASDLGSLQIDGDAGGGGAGDGGTQTLCCGFKAPVEVKVNFFDLYKAEGNGLVKAESYPEALEKYELAWKECKTDDDKAMILNNQGVVYEKMGDTDKALEIFKEALSIKPEYVKVLLRRALIFKKLKRFDEAIEDLSDAQVLAMKNNQTLTGLQESLTALIMEYTEVEIEKIRATRTFGFPKEIYVVTFLRGFYCDPVSRVWKGLDPSPLDAFLADPANETVLPTGFLAALDCLKHKKFPEVPGNCTVEIDNPEAKFRMEALMLRGSMKFLCGDGEAALEDFKMIIEDASASKQMKSSAHLKSALVQNLWGTCEQVADHFAQAEQIWKENADVYYHAAVCLVDKGEAVPALALLEKGVEECPDPKQCPVLHVLRLSIQTSYNACVYSASSADETMKQLKEMEQNGVFDSPECYEMYGQALLLLDVSGDETAAAFDKAVEISGGDKFFKLKKVMASLMRTQNREAALATLSGFTDDEDMASVAYYHIGEINMMLQNFDEGFSAIKKSIEFSNSIYDVKLRVMGYVDFQYNAKLAEKMKMHGIDLFNQQPDDTNRALE